MLVNTSIKQNIFFVKKSVSTLRLVFLLLLSIICCIAIYTFYYLEAPTWVPVAFGIAYALYIIVNLFQLFRRSQKYDVALRACNLTVSDLSDYPDELHIELTPLDNDSVGDFFMPFFVSDSKLNKQIYDIPYSQIKDAFWCAEEHSLLLICNKQGLDIKQSDGFSVMVYSFSFEPMDYLVMKNTLRERCGMEVSVQSFSEIPKKIMAYL